MDAALGPITAEDLVWLRDWEDEDGFAAMTCRPIRHRSREERLALYQSVLNDPDQIIRGLWLTGEERPIGKLTAVDWNPRNRSMEAGYFLRREWRGAGYMHSALQSFCCILFRERGCNKVTAQTGAFNLPSIRLLESCHFRRDGVLRQHHEKDGILWDDYLYCLLAEEFKKHEKAECEKEYVFTDKR